MEKEYTPHSHVRFDYENVPFISRIVMLKKGDKKFDVVFSLIKSPILYILSFHSTIVMNIFTGHSLLTLYPTKTSQDTTIICRSMDRFSRYRRDERVKIALEKYMRRGVLAVKPGRRSDDSLDHHVCEVDESCPHTLRCIDDKFTCTFTMGPEDPMLEEIRSTVWRYGGNPCFNEGRRTDALIVTNCGHLVLECDV